MGSVVTLLYSDEHRCGNLVVRNFLFREFSTSIRAKHKKATKEIYYIYSIEHQVRITLQQSVASNNCGYGTENT